MENTQTTTTTTINTSTPKPTSQPQQLQPQPQPTPRKRPPRPEIPHAHLTDAQLFALDPDLIQGAVLLRLSRSYSNQAIYQRINANHAPGLDFYGQEQSQRVKSVNVITKRLTHAIKNLSKASGRSEREIRVAIAEAKRARGVAHKGKVDVTPYG